MYSPFGRSRDKQRWEIHIVQFDSYVHLSESPDTMIPLQTGLCGGTKKISIIRFLFCPWHKFISSTVSHSPQLEIGMARQRKKLFPAVSSCKPQHYISSLPLSGVLAHTLFCSTLIIVSLSFCISACFK